jgi:hypothetical protein
MSESGSSASQNGTVGDPSQPWNKTPGGSPNLSITYQTEIQIQIRQVSLNVRYQMFMTLYEERYRNMLGNILGGQY